MKILFVISLAIAVMVSNASTLHYICDDDGVGWQGHLIRVDFVGHEFGISFWEPSKRIGWLHYNGPRSDLEEWCKWKYTYTKVSYSSKLCTI